MGKQWKKESRQQRLRALWRVYRSLLLAAMAAIAMTILSWFAALDIGDSFPLQEALVLWGIFLGMVIPSTLHTWRRHVAAKLYYEDITDGVCPDRGMQITPENGWKWCKKQGSPVVDQFEAQAALDAPRRCSRAPGRSGPASPATTEMAALRRGGADICAHKNSLQKWVRRVAAKLNFDTKSNG